MSRNKLFVFAMAVALLGASPCFGDKPVVCEAHDQVWTCDKNGCVPYGLGDPLPLPTPTPAAVPIPKPYCCWPNSVGSISGTVVVNGEIGMEQWIPDENGVLVLACLPSGAACYADTIPVNADPIPMQDFKRVTKP